MLTEPKLKSQIDSIWDRLWSGGLANPMDAIEQLSYLIFLKRIDEREDQLKKLAEMQHLEFKPKIPADMRWNYWTKLQAERALNHLKQVVFPRLSELGGENSSFSQYMKNAECKFNKPNLLIETCNLIEGLSISEQNQDVQGDIYEYLLSKLNVSGRNGQFRTPRHIIRMMVRMIDPKVGERIGDLAAGTAGFLVNAYQYILQQNTTPDILEFMEGNGFPHNLAGDYLKPEQRDFLQHKALRGFDNDSGMTMLRIGSMNLILHGIESPQYFYKDTLSRAFTEVNEYDVILMNPPFKGAVDKGDVSENLPADTTKTELLFIHLILRTLDMGGRCAVIVPDGVLFGTSRAHVALRKKLIEDNRLDGVVSMPSGVFKPYSGVSTAVLLFTKGAKTEKIWFYDMVGDGFSLDDKRTPGAENDIPDIVECWKNRFDEKFNLIREVRRAELKKELSPLNDKRNFLQTEINQLTFEKAIVEEGDEKYTKELEKAQEGLDGLQEIITPLQKEFDQLNSQFWVEVKELEKNNFDLNANRYHMNMPEGEYIEKPEGVIEKLTILEEIIQNEISSIKESLD